MKNGSLFTAFVAAFVAMLSVSSFSEAVVAQNNVQSDAQIVNEFITGLRTEFMVDEELEVRSVERKGNVVVIDTYDDKGLAELYCEVLRASKRYLADHPVDLNLQMKKVMTALQSQGISFRYSVADTNSGKKYNVDFTAKEFVCAYAFEGLDIASDMSSGIFKYIPFNKIVEIMNTFMRGSSNYFLCENGRLYIVMQAGNQDFAGLKEAYDIEPDTFVELMKESVASMSEDKDFKAFLDLAHANGYRFAVRITSPTNESISFDAE